MVVQQTPSHTFYTPGFWLVRNPLAILMTLSLFSSKCACTNVHQTEAVKWYSSKDETVSRFWIWNITKSWLLMEECEIIFFHLSLAHREKHKTETLLRCVNKPKPFWISLLSPGSSMWLTIFCYLILLMYNSVSDFIAKSLCENRSAEPRHCDGFQTSMWKFMPVVSNRMWVHLLSQIITWQIVAWIIFSISTQRILLCAFEIH